MKILAIDSSNHPMSVALVEDDQLLATTTLNMVRNHSIFLLPVIDDLFQKVQWQPQDLDRVVVAQGPGSYNGIRIAVTTAKVLADTLDMFLQGPIGGKMISWSAYCQISTCQCRPCWISWQNLKNRS